MIVQQKKDDSGNLLPHSNLIALAPTGCGKTAAFAVGSILRINREDKRTQVIVVTHTRELAK